VGADAVVLLSGGLDSATTLALAIQRDGMRCHTLSLDYGQRHRAELAAATRVSAALGAAAHQELRVDLASLGGSALTDPEIAVPAAGGSGIPVTYVPARNTVFLSLALAHAEVVDAVAIYIGVNAVDYSGYPDCRPAYIAAFQALADLATRAGVEGRGPELRTPLIDRSKAEIVRLAAELEVDLALTVSCYSADPAGRACGCCDACRLRRDGFAAAGLVDPTRYVAEAPSP
jgi:7-cyano-7-deazaguanine synthase